MPTPGSAVGTVPMELNSPPLGALGHMRATVLVGDQLLSACLVGGKIPSGTNVPKEYPIAVTIQVESVDAANLVFVAGCDGTSTLASATSGLQVPIAPAFLRIPFKNGMKTDAGTIRIASTVGTAHVQCFFEYFST